MVRKWREKVEPLLEFEDRAYSVRIVEVSKGEDMQMLFTLEHQDDEQRGRITEVMLQRPIRPGGLAAQIFAACGQEVKVGAVIEPEACVGLRIRVFMEKEALDGQWRVARARPFEEVSHGE